MPTETGTGVPTRDPFEVNPFQKAISAAWSVAFVCAAEKETKTNRKSATPRRRVLMMELQAAEEKEEKKKCAEKMRRTIQSL